MTTAEAKINPLDLFSQSVSAWTDFSRSAGEAWLETMLSMRPDAEKTTGEDLTRDVFRKLADLNLQHWENAAKVIDAMPRWMHWPQVLPGDMVTDWFDQVRRGDGAGQFMKLFGSVRFDGETPEDALRRPLGIDAPDGDADDLTRIKGIGPKLSKTLNELGVFHFRQIAGWEDAEARWVDDFLAFKGRVEREQWIEQAQKLAANGSVH